MRSPRPTSAYAHDGPWEGDALAAETFSQSFGRPLTPEQRLLLAVLEDGIVELHRMVRYIRDDNRPAWRERHAAIVQWFRDIEDDHLYSLGSICAHLGLDAEGISSRVLADAPAITRQHDGWDLSEQMPIGGRRGGPRRKP